MSKKQFGSLMVVVSLVAVMGLAVDSVAAKTRVAQPGQRSTAMRSQPKVGGPNCASATVVGALPWTDTDNTCGAPAVVTDYFSANCNTFDYPGPELIYQIELGDANEVQIKLKPAAADMGLFLLNDCTDGNSCVGFMDAIGGGAESWVAPGQTVMVPGQSEAQSFPSVPGATYWIYVDSYYQTGALSCGAYTLTVAGDVPVELIDFKVE